jgi:hypothetical protein
MGGAARSSPESLSGVAAGDLEVLPICPVCFVTHVPGRSEELGRCYNEDSTWNDARDSLIDLRQQFPKASQGCVIGFDCHYTDLELLDVLLIA